MKQRIIQVLMLSAIFLLMRANAHAQADTPIDEWSFASSYVTIDNTRYQLDTTHKLAQWYYWYTDEAPEEVVIPSTVTYQGETYTVVSAKGSTYEQKKTTSLTLPATLRYIGEYVFYSFTNVHEFTIPASVESLDRNITRDNTVLRFQGTTPPATKGDLSYNNKLKVYVPGEAFEDYFQTDYIEDCCVISSDPTKGTIELDEVGSGELGYSVVGARLPQITNYANVNKLIIHAGTLDETDWYQIRQMKNLVEIQIPDMDITELPADAMKDCWQLERVTLPTKLLTINGYAFYNTGVSNLTLPSGLTTITGSHNFYNCDSLKSIIIPDGVTSLPYRCFYDCDLLASAKLPAALASMGSYCFYSCDLKTINIPGTLTVVPADAFEYNENMTSVVLNEGIAELNDYSFRGCISLQELTCPSSLRVIHSSAFSGCKGLTNVDFNEGLEQISGNAFYACTGLTEITLPSSLIYCLSYPFNGCNNLTQINCMSLLPPTVRNNVITYETNNIELHVPLWSFQEYMTTPGWLEFQPHIVIDESILPENIYINKEFSFMLKESQMKEGYTPNVRLDYNTELIDDGFGHQKYERGNLTISSQSTLDVNNFTMYVSPYAKFFADKSRFYYNHNYDYDDYKTQYNPNSLIVKGQMRAENQVYKLWLRNDLWQFISFPFDVNVSDIVPTVEGTQWVVRSYDGAKRAAQAFDETWTNLTASDVLVSGRGYIMKCYHSDYTNNSTPVEFTVTPIEDSFNRQLLFSSEDREIALNEYTSELEQNRSWNLIGNPYPCYYDTRYLQTEAPFLVWDSYNRTYAAFSPVDDSYILNPAEAFFIQRPVHGTESLLFLKGGRQTYRNPNDLTVNEVRALFGRSANSQRQVINLLLTQDERSDRTRVVFNEAATADYEIGRDAAKMLSSDATAPQLWSTAGKSRYAINERPLADGVVRLSVRASGQATIALKDEVEGLVIEDLATGTITALTTEGYTFAANGTAEGRFLIRKTDATAIGAVEDALQNEDTDTYYNLQGQRVDKNHRGIVIKNGKKIINH